MPMSSFGVMISSSLLSDLESSSSPISNIRCSSIPRLSIISSPPSKNSPSSNSPISLKSSTSNTLVASRSNEGLAWSGIPSSSILSGSSSTTATSPPYPLTKPTPPSTLTSNLELLELHASAECCLTKDSTSSLVQVMELLRNSTGVCGIEATSSSSLEESSIKPPLCRTYSRCTASLASF